MASLMHGEGGQVGTLIGYWQWDVNAASAYRIELPYDQVILAEAIVGLGGQLYEELKETASNEAFDGTDWISGQKMTAQEFHRRSGM